MEFLIILAGSVCISSLVYHFSKGLKSKKRKKDSTESLRRIGELFLKIKSPYLKKYTSTIEGKISVAGLKGWTPSAFIGLQVLIGILTSVFFTFMFEAEVLFVIPFFILGGAMPLVWLNSQIRKRKREIFRSLPDALDLLTLSLEAGLDFNSALNRYLEKGGRGILHQEFQIVQQEISMGKSRKDALRSMAERAIHPALRRVIESIVQAIELGSSLGPILRSLSDDLRAERMEIAEKLAHEAPIKMLFPLVFFIFPTVFIILFGSIVLNFLYKGF